jgi:hypothetical protein
MDITFPLVAFAGVILATSKSLGWESLSVDAYSASHSKRHRGHISRHDSVCARAVLLVFFGNGSRALRPPDSRASVASRLPNWRR